MQGGLRDKLNCAFWYPYDSHCLQHIAWLQAKAEEPGAAETEGRDMKPEDATGATRAVESRAKRWQ